MFIAEGDFLSLLFQAAIRRMGSNQMNGLSKFAWTCLVFQIVVGGAYFLLVRYAPSADAKHIENQLHKDEELEENLEKYPS